MNRTITLLLAALTPLAALCATPGAAPSRPAEKGCAWEKLTDQSLGLEAWVQRCDFGFRKIDLLVAGKSLSIHYSDGVQHEPLVDVYALEGDETPAAGITRVFKAHTDAKLAARCVLAPFKGEPRAPAGVQRYSFVPDAKFAKELKKTESPDEVGEPPCGEFGDAPDGIQYFEAQPASGARAVLFVRYGQDTPLFDEQTLRLLPGR
jgi:hypothetical protein